MRAFFGILAAALAGCAANGVPESRIPDVGTGNVEAEPMGTLVVRTQERWLGSRVDMQRAEHEQETFNVRDEEGDILRAEVSDSVMLEPGRYLVEVPRATDHARWFWVTVEAGEITEVDARKLRTEAR